MTLHSVFNPQGSGQGETHFWLIHASVEEHSLFTTHSGLQLGGLPMYVGKQEQTAWPFISRHLLFGPQGDG